MGHLENDLQKRLHKELPHLDNWTPGLRLQVHWQGRKKADLALGKTYPYYDLASLTKIIFTTSALIRALDQKLFRPNDAVQKFVPWWPHKNHTLGHLMTHTSGLPSYQAFFKQVDLKASREQRWNDLTKILPKVPLQRGRRRCLYSDPGFLLLAYALESIYQFPLDEIWTSLQSRWGLEDLCFHPNNRPFFSRSQYAPTVCAEEGLLSRRGEVNDLNTWYLGGVSAQAGLFGTIDEVSRWGLLLRKAYRGTTKNSLGTPTTVRRFCRRQIPLALGQFGFGFMKPSPRRSSTGHFFSPSSFGHIGFTGTSLWYEPRKDLLVVVLANRHNPAKKGFEFQKLRSLIHDEVVQSWESNAARQNSRV